MQDPDGGEGEGFAAVLQRAASGDTDAATALFTDMNPRVLRYLRSQEPRAADDIAGDVWLAVAKGLAAFEGTLADFRSWVFSIARRRVADHRRTAVRRATDPMSPDNLAFVAPHGDDPARSAVERLTAQEAADTIRDLLPADHAEVLLLRVLGDLDVGHVAAIMGRTANWVRVTQHRASRRLADALAVRAEQMDATNSAEAVMPTPPRTISLS